MLDYRIYWLDANGHIVRADNLVAADDAEARGKPEALLGWHQRSRFSAPIGWWCRRLCRSAHIWRGVPEVAG